MKAKSLQRGVTEEDFAKAVERLLVLEAIEEDYGVYELK